SGSVRTRDYPLLCVREGSRLALVSGARARVGHGRQAENVAHVRSPGLATSMPSSAKGEEIKPVGTTPCSACPIRKLKGFREFDPEEVAFVERFKLGELTVKAGSHVFLEGHDSAHLF